MKKLMITVIGAMALWTPGAESAWAGKSSDGYMAVDHVGVPVTPVAPVVIPGEAETSTNWSAIPRSRDKHDIL